MAAKKETGNISANENETIKNVKPVASGTEPVAPSSEEFMVKIKLFKDDDKYKDDLVVGVNGKVYQIQRGMEVEVPLCVAEVIENQERQDKETARKIAEAVEKYRKKNS